MFKNAMPDMNVVMWLCVIMVIIRLKLFTVNKLNGRKA